MVDEAIRRSEGGYRRRWREVPRATGYLLGVFPFSILALVVLITLFAAGIGTLILVIGLPLFHLTLRLAWFTGTAQLGLLRVSGLPTITAPAWPRARADASLLARLAAPLRSAHAWSYLVHQMVIGPVVSILTFTFTVTWWSVSLGGLTYGIWSRALPGRSPGDDWPAWIARQFGWPLSSATMETLIYLVGGILFALTLPWALGAMTRMHHLIAGMLGRWAGDDLADRAREEASARRAAIRAEQDGLRRLERDLHDGPQQRLIRLQLDLAAAERRAQADDPEQAVVLMGQARRQAQSVLEELRALSRGVAPPLLADRGLSAALRALVEDHPGRVRFRLDRRLDTVVGPEVARTCYFVAAELLANVAKHAQGATVDLAAELIEDDPLELRLRVVDDGPGGARLIDGHGLAGLQQRVQGQLGRLTVSSPVEGPTEVTVLLPVGAQALAVPTGNKLTQ